MADQNRNGNQGAGGAGDTTGGRRNPADNLSREDRVRGGERSAQLQQRDERGQFAGRKGQQSESNRGNQGGGNSGNNR